MKTLFAVTILTMTWCMATSLQVKATTSSLDFKKGQPLSLIWRFNKTEDERIISLILYMDDNYTESLATISGFTETGTRLFKKARNMTLEIVEQEYFNLTIPLLAYVDEHVYQLEIICGKGQGPKRTLTTKWNNIDIHNITGDPEFCNGRILDEYTFLGNETANINITVCGKPKPSLSLKLNKKTGEAEGVLVNKQHEMYRYTVQLPTLYRQYCGKHIEFFIRGLSEIKTTSTILLKFEPSKLRITRAKKSENWTSISWNKEDIGNCLYQYNLIFYDGNSDEIANILTTRKTTPTYNTSNKNVYTNATHVQVRAIFHDRAGDLSESVAIEKERPAATTITTATTTTTTTTTITNSNPATTTTPSNLVWPTILSTSTAATKRNNEHRLTKTLEGILIVASVIALIVLICTAHFIKMKCKERQRGFYAARKEEEKLESPEDENANDQDTIIDSPFNYFNEKTLNLNVHPDSIIRRYEKQDNRNDGVTEMKRLSDESVESGFDEGEVQVKCKCQQTKDAVV